MKCFQCVKQHDFMQCFLLADGFDDIVITKDGEDSFFIMII